MTYERGNCRRKEWQGSMKDIWKSYGCKAKVFAKESGAMKKKIEGIRIF